MSTYRLLILTDHATHSKENSLYAIGRHLLGHPNCERIDIASRSHPLNQGFFKHLNSRKLWVKTIDASFDFDPSGRQLIEDAQHLQDVSNYDFIFLRLPRPIPKGFFEFLEKRFNPQRIVNRPSGIQETGSKAFLLNFQEHCPPIRLCHSIQDIEDFKQNFTIVLKPIESYGGKGICKVDGEKVWEGNSVMEWKTYAQQLTPQDFPILAMQFLKNVHLGDKRILVVNGEVLGTSLRLPAKDSWMCNVAQGGSSVQTTITPEEMEMVKKVSPLLIQKGILIFGMDTLTGDDGKRVLSEINTLSIGGFPQIQQLSGKPVLSRMTELFWQYLDRQYWS